MNDEQFFLANAYLDGELTDEERAVAEADPAVMAEVEELRALQAGLRDVEPPAAEARESAIAAAMAAFTAAPTSPVVPPTAPAPIPFRRRPAYARYLAVAAGVLGVGLLGVAVTRLGTGGGDDSADEATAEPAAEEPAAEEPAAEEPAATERDMAETMVAEDAASDDGAGFEAAADEPAMGEAPVEEPAEEPAAQEPAAEEPASGDPAYDLSSRPDLVPGQVLTTPAELGAYGTGLIEQRDAGTLPPTPNHSCDVENVLGTAEYLTGDVVRLVLVAVDEEFEIVYAYTEDGCDFVVDGPLYLDQP